MYSIKIFINGKEHSMFNFNNFEFGSNCYNQVCSYLHDHINFELHHQVVVDSLCNDESFERILTYED